MKKILFIPLLILTMLVASSFVLAVAQGSSSDKEILDIRVEGNYAISTATILNQLKMRPGEKFVESSLNREIKRLYATGYFADVFVEIEDKPDGVVVVFTVVEKPVVEKVEFRGNAQIKSRRLLKKVSLQEGTLLDFSIISQDMSAIRNHYIEEGYSNVTVDYKVETDPATGKAIIIYVIDEGTPLRIKSITFEGNEHFPAKELEQYMSTKTAWWFIRKGAFDDDKFQSDLSRIRTMYRGKGFLDARLTNEINYTDDGQFMLVTILVDEGERYLAGEVTIEGELAFPEEDIRNRIHVKTGDPFDYTMIKEDTENIRTFYYDKGYMNAEVDLKHRYNSTDDRMDMVYAITAHEEVYVGMINVLGNTKTRDKVIRRELRVYPGEKYDGERLKKSKERIYNLGFFEDVYFETIPTADPNVKNLNVTVKETKTGEISFGGGYSSVDAFIGFAQVRQRNFDLLNFPTFTGGGQNLTIRGEIGNARTNYFLSWTDPWIFDFPYLFGFDIYRQEHKQFGDSGYGYDETRTGGSLRLGKEITDDLSVGLVYNLEEVQISNLQENASEALTRELGTNWISRITLNTEYDRRDNKYSPTKGFVVGGSIENAGGFIGGTKDFVKAFGYGSYYYSIIESVVLELKLQGGAVQNYGKSEDVPIYERFFAGGGSTIRGYKERGVGPRDVGSNTALGGEAMLIGNVEVTFPIWKKLIKGAVFFDAGNVWEEADLKVLTTAKDDSGIKAGTGIGVRVKTPIGPVKLDYGFPLNKNYDDKREGQFYFSVTHGF